MTRDERNNLIWNNWYELAKKYYEEHGDLNVPQKYVTKEGKRLGNWLMSQRQIYNGTNSSGGTLNKERIFKLNAIGMVWNIRPDFDEEWNKKYELAKQFYEKNGHLNIPIDYEIENVKLGEWVRGQRSAKKGKSTRIITSERIKKLDEIGMIWDLQEDKFNDYLKCAKKFYEEHGHLNIPGRFVTSEGKKLGQWLINQRKAYRDGRLSNDRTDKLNEINMIWNVDDIIPSNVAIVDRTKLKLLNLAKEVIEDIQGNFKSKDDVEYINELFIEELDKRLIKKLTK